MSCIKCEEAENSGMVAYYRVDKANVAIIGCDEHVKKVFEAMERGGINKPPTPNPTLIKKSKT